MHWPLWTALLLFWEEGRTLLPLWLQPASAYILKGHWRDGSGGRRVWWSDVLHAQSYRKEKTTSVTHWELVWCSKKICHLRWFLCKNLSNESNVKHHVDVTTRAPASATVLGPWKQHTDRQTESRCCWAPHSQHVYMHAGTSRPNHGTAHRELGSGRCCREGRATATHQEEKRAEPCFHHWALAASPGHVALRAVALSPLRRALKGREVYKCNTKPPGSP